VIRIQRIMILKMAFLTALTSCKQNRAVDEIGGSAAKDCSASNITSSGSRVSFYGDLYPILNSNFRNRVYKCSTCHAEYNDPVKLANVPELVRVIDSMKSLRMPRGGDPVPAAMIDLFSKWRFDGFTVGKLGDNPSDAGLRAGVASLLHRDCQP
jgi:hypothetical protein